MKTIFGIIFCLIITDVSNADNSGGCQIDAFDAANWILLPIHTNDTMVDAVLLESSYAGSLEIGACSSSSNTGNIVADVSKYFSLSKTETSLTVSSTSEFVNLDKDAFTNGVAIVTLNLQCTFTCSSTSTMALQIIVVDINTNEPEFLQPAYEFKVPVPIMPQTDISVYGDISVEATDLDFSNSNITFSIEPDDFALTTTRVDDKIFQANFRTRNILRLTENATYTITATDSGTNPGQLKGTSTLTVMVDKSTSLDTPSFSSNTFTFDYTVQEDGSPKLQANDGPIEAVTVKPESISRITLEGEYASSFKAEHSNTTFTISLDESSPLPSTTGSIIVLTLSFETDATASTILLINVASSQDEDSPKFDNFYYTGSYSSADHTVSLDNPIIVTSTGTPEVTISGTYSKKFNATCKDNICQIKATKLDDSDFNKYSDIVLSLNAISGTKKGTASLVISLPNASDAPTFSSAYYSANYSIGTEKPSIDLKEDINITNKNDPKKITISFDSYNSYFKIDYNSTTSKWDLILSENLPDELLKSTTAELVITLNAKDEETDTIGQSVLLIKLPKKVLPTFTKAFYSATYVVLEDGANVELEDDIEIENIDQSTAKITLDQYGENFNIIYSESKWNMAIKNVLDDSILKSYSYLAITLTASGEDIENTVQAVLVLKWSSIENVQEAPEFSKAYYLGTYTTENGGSVEVDSIEIINKKNTSAITISLDNYDKNFNIIIEDDHWKIKVNVPLEKDTLEQYTELDLTLTASEDGNNNTGRAVLIVTLPSQNVTDFKPTFSQHYYQADYTLTENVVSLKMNDTITVDGENTKVFINSSDYFEIISKDDQYEVKVKTPISDDILESQVSIVLTLVAQANNVEGYATLVVNLPAHVRTSAISFNEVLYSGVYQVVKGSGKLTIHGDIGEGISVKTDAEDVDIGFITNSAVSKYFQVSYSNKTFGVAVQDLPTDVLQNYTVITLTLTAKVASDTARSVLNINVEYNRTPTNGSDDDDDDKIAFITAVVILSVLLLAFIALSAFLWCFKIRNRTYVKMDDDIVDAKPAFTKNFTKASDIEPSNNTIERRRPTGFVFRPVVDDEELSDRETSDNTKENRERKKSVAFDDKVEKMHIESVNDDDNGSSSEICLENGDVKVSTVNADNLTKYLVDNDGGDSGDICSENGEECNRNIVKINKLSS